MEKYVELIEKTSKEKSIMQSSSPDDYIRHYNSKILNLFGIELQPTNTENVISDKWKYLLDETKKFKAQF